MNWLIILISVIVICYLIYIYYPIKESMHSKPIKKINIVLLGDYILHEPKSQQYPSIKEMFKEKFPLANVNAFTSECKTLEKFRNEIKKMSPGKYNNKDTYFFLSIGSSAIHKNLINCSKVHDVKPTQTNSGKRSKCLSSKQLEESWMPEIDILKEKFKKAKIIIIGSYYPKKGSTIKLCDEFLKSNNMLHENIETWNNDISNYSQCDNTDKSHKKKDCKTITYIPLNKYINPDEDLEKDGYTIKAHSIKKLAKILFHEIK